jgi:hypothetical protein
VLVTEDHPAHLVPLAQMVAERSNPCSRPVATAAAYRIRCSAAFRKGQAGINRPAFASDLVERWIPAAVDIHTRLMSSPLRPCA